MNIPVVQQRQEVVQKIVEMYRFSTNGANGSEDRGGYTSAVLDKVVDMSVVGATPSAHGSGGAENSWS